MYHYTYILIDPVTADYYIGKHSTENLEDGYMGSGAWPSNMQLEGKELYKAIIDFYETSEEAYLAENLLISDKWKNDKKCKNMKPGGQNSFFEPDVYSNYCMSRWGVSHHMKSSDFLKESNFNFPFCHDEIQKKVDETLRKKYSGRGSGSIIIKERVEITNLRKYGEKHTLNIDKVKKAREKSIMEKYGTTNPFENPEKLADVLEERYGYRNPMHNEENRKKHKIAMENKDWSERNKKSKETNLKKYSFSVAANAPEVRERNKRTCPFGCRDNHRFDVGNFTNHMKSIHNWTAEEIKEYKNANPTNSN
jgi:hypothetical protein